MKKHRYFCGCSTLAAVLSLYSLQAHAEEAQAAPAAPAPQATAPSATVSDLVVTAERREQRLESVPAAISAYGAEQRALVGMASVQDLSDYTPGLAISTLTNRPYVRGVGRNTDNLATESAVAVYYNNVYDGANASTLLQHSDLFIDTIEVDRGPQNLLHGSNADGGAINYVSKRPTKSFYAEGRVGVENYDKQYGEAVVSGPINDNIRFRLGGNYTNQSGGFFDNLNGKNQGGTVVQGNSGMSRYLEGQLDANFGDFDAWAMASSGNFRATYHTVATQGDFPTNLFLNGTFSPSSFYGLCGLPGVMGSANGAGCATGPGVVGTPLTQQITANQFPGNNPTTADPRKFIQNYTSSNNLKNDISLATQLTYHMPSANLTYYGGYQKFDYELDFTTAADSGILSYQLPGAATAAAAGLCGLDAGVAGYNAAGCTQPLTINPAPNLTHFVEKESFFSHELDLTSNTDSPVQWIGGLYWYHEHYEQPVWAGVVPNQTQFANPYYIGAGGALIKAPVNPASAASTSDTFLTYNSYAAFGQVDWKINDQFKLTAGARYTKDKKHGMQQWRFEEFDLVPGFTSSQFGANTPALDLTSAAVGASATTAYPGASTATLNPATGNYERDLGASWDAWTGAVNLNWTPDPTTLVYAKYSRGYKTGGFSTNTISAFPETKPEKVDAFEAGLKKTGQTFQINGALFYYNYKNDQQPVEVQDPVSQVLFAQIFNLKEVHTWGAEVEGIWRPIDPFTLSVQYSHLDAKIHNAGQCFEDTVDPLATQRGANTAGCGPGTATAKLQNINGQQLPESAPNKVSVNALYAFTFDPGKLTLSASYVWKDKTYGSVFNRDYSTSKAYSQTNLRATWADAQNRYNVIVFCNNVFDQKGYDNTNGTLLAAGNAISPEQIVTNRYLTAPRTYGLELEYRFQ